MRREAGQREGPRGPISLADAWDRVPGLLPSPLAPYRLRPSFGRWEERGVDTCFE